MSALWERARRGTGVAVVLVSALALPMAAGAQAKTTSLGITIPTARDADPIVLSGSALGDWSVPSNTTVKLPLTDLFSCLTFSTDNCAHNNFVLPEIDTAKLQNQGIPIARFLGYRWDGAHNRFDQIPFQVDERFTRYLDNSASGFAIYSGDDQHTTYAYDGPSDREGFRYTKDGPANDPCHAQAATPPARDPIGGMDNNDEVAFMASDAGPAAPRGAKLPAGIVGSKRFSIVDPLHNPQVLGYVYIMQSAANGPRAAFNGSNGYVHYQRTKNADEFVFSQSSYDNYGNAATGVYCDPKTGKVVIDPKTGKPAIGRRRPLDNAKITTPRYQFRYEGRWLMDQIKISPDNGHTYGPDLIDRWKARAFAQDPGSETPCCGYEEEENNWGGSSTLLGERVGPVRTIRETWGSDSGTNVIRRETFYRDEVLQNVYLRVHPIPPLDGLYAQLDFNAGRMDRYYNPQNPKGVPVDGRNDDMFGNFDDPCNPRYDHNTTSKFDQTYRSLYKALQLCHLPYHLSADEPDLSFSGINAALGWNVTTGKYGTIVDRVSLDPGDITPGGLAQSLLAVPYYRDDSCFDDGTGGDPGPKIIKRSDKEPQNDPATGQPRKCWTPADRLPHGNPKYFQGSIGTHGMHLLAIAESDNARQTVPLDEIAAQWRMIMLPGRRDGAAGELYGRDFEKPLLAVPSG